MTHVYYEAKYNEMDAPKIYKIVDIDGDPANDISTVILLQNSEELNHVTSDIIWSHIENLVAFMNLNAGTLAVSPVGVFPSDGWPVIGWGPMELLNAEINNWWYFLARRDTEPHTHDA